MVILEALDQTTVHVRGTSDSLSPEKFIKCLKKFYSHCKEDISDHWGASNAISIAAPPPSEDIRYRKSLALSMWFFGREFTDTIVVFLSRHIHFLSAQENCDLVKPLVMPVSKAVGINIVLHNLKKGDTDAALMDEVLHLLIANSESSSLIIGCIAREKPEGRILEEWSQKLHGSMLKLYDVSGGISELLAVKDLTEILYVKKAANLTTSVMRKFVVPKLEDIIADERKVSHSKLMELTEKTILSPMKVNVKLKAENVDICYPPIFQSGGKYDLKPGALSNDDNLYFDSGSIIVCAMGAKYSGYCSNVARTFLIDCSVENCNAYKILLKAHDAAIASLMPGSKANVSYQTTVAVVRDEAPYLLPFLTKSFGTGIGIEFRETLLSLNEKNDLILKEGMIFNVSLGFHNLPTKAAHENMKEISMWLADTVLVCKEEPQVLTALIPKADDDAIYSFDEEITKSPSDKPAAIKVEVLRPLKENLRSNSRTSKEDLRRQLQSEIFQKRSAEIAIRGGITSSKLLEGHGSLGATGELVAYKNSNDFPDSNRLEIQVDKQNDAILLPIYGTAVPFHVCTIKKAEIRGDCNIGVYVCITFNVPNTSSSLQDSRLPTNASLVFLKAVTFLSRNKSMLKR